MRLAALFSPLLFAATTSAQCTTSNLGFTPGTQPVTISGLDVNATSIVTVAKPYLPNGFLYGYAPRGIRVTKNDMNGQLLWERRLIPTNVSINMAPKGVLATQDDGAFIYGDLAHTTYTNQFAIKLASDGTTEWARIYMLPDSAISPSPYNVPQYQGLRSAVRKGMDQLANGGYAWVIRNEREFYHVLLDGTGLPQRALAYGDTAAAYPSAEVRTAPDGSFFATSFGALSGYLRVGYFHATAGGQVDWAYRIDNSYGQQPQPIPSSTGDYVIDFHRNNGVDHQFLRIDPSGTPLAARTRPIYGSGYHNMVELMDGTFLEAHGPHVVWHASNGAILNRWTLAGTAAHLATNGSDIAFASNYSNLPPSFSLATDMADLTAGCNLTVNANQTTTANTITTSPIQIGMDTAFVKTWTLALGEAPPNTLDLHAGCHMDWARPGFSTIVLGAAANASASISGPLTVSCTLPVPVTPTNIIPAPTSVNGNVITWLVPGGLPADGYWPFQLEVLVDADTALIGSTLTTTVVLTQDSVELDLANNTATFDRIVTASFDPNAKEVRTSSGTSNVEYFPALDEHLDYTIHFQNTGSDTAFTVVLVDTLPAELSVGSLTVMGASHPYTYELNGAGILRFTFNDILLPDSTTNEAASHGMVSFRIRPDDGLSPGTTITNVADIFFDFNPPIRTPDATVVVTAPTAVAALAPAQAISVFPNPARDRIEVLLPADLEVTGWSIAGTDGRPLRHQGLALTRGRLSVPLHGLAPGLYVLQLYSVEGRMRTVRFAVE